MNKYQTKKLGEILDKSKFSIGKIKTKEYLYKGNFPIVDQGKKLIGGYSDNKELVYNGKLPVIVYGDHTNIVKYIDFKFIGGADGIKVLPFTDNYDVKYCYYLLENFKPKTQGYRRHFSFFKEIDLPFPPLPTQKLIVQKLDSAFKNIDESIKITKKNIKNIEELNKSSLDNIFKNGNFDEEIFGEICDFVRGPFGGSLKKEIFKKTGYAIYEQMHAIGNQYTEIRYYIDENKFNEMKRFELLSGNLIMSCSGTMGKVSIVPKRIKKGIINQALLILKPYNKLLNKYLKLFMESGIFQEEITKYSKGAAIKNVASVKILKKIKIPLPPLSKQKEIVSYLDKVFEKNKVIKEGYKKKLKELEEMKQSILKEAFEGRLVKD